MYFAGILYGLGYIFYMTLGWSNIPLKKPYNRLFENRILLIHVSVNLLISAVALYRCSIGYFRETFFIAPLVFLIMLTICNRLARAFVGRNVIFSARGDVKPTTYKWFVDAPMNILIVGLPVCTCGYLMNFFRSVKFLS